MKIDEYVYSLLLKHKHIERHKTIMLHNIFYKKTGYIEKMITDDNDKDDNNDKKQ